MGQAYLPKAVTSYNEAINRGQAEIEEEGLASKDGVQNEINELFEQAREEALVTTDFSELFS